MFQRRIPWQMSAVAAVVALPILIACGGSGDDDDEGGTPGVALSGTATDGAALAGRDLTLRCADGSTPSATTDGAGRYELPALAASALPCVLQATTSGGTGLHAVATALGTANLTPVTSLVVAALGGESASDYYEGFDATAAAAATAAHVAAATATVTATLDDAGYDASGAGDPHTASLDAGSDGAALVADVGAGLVAGGTTLSQLEAVVAQASPVAAPAAGDTPTLPAAMLLRPAAADCAALRSGRYVFITPGSDASSLTETIEVDAETLAVEFGEGDSGQLQAVGECHFTENVDGATDDFIVSPAGVVLWRWQDDNGVYRLAIGVPEQTHSVAELAGHWNALSTDTAESGVAAYRFTAARDGSVSSIVECPGIVDCTPVDGTATISGNGDGSFRIDSGDPGAEPDRAFAYRSGNGVWLVANVFGDGGGFELWTRQRTVTPPAVGAVTRNWNLWVNTALESTAPLNESDFTTLASDATSWTRQAADGHQETLFANSPRDGFNRRDQGTAMNDAGQTVTVNAFYAMSLGPIGITALWFPTIGLPSAPGGYFFSVARP